MNAHISVSIPTVQPDVRAQKIDYIGKTARIFSISFFMTGVFAALGALYQWGDGPLFPLAFGADVELYLAELLVAAPASMMASIGISRLRRWGMLAAIFSTGVYIYGSILVYCSMFLMGAPYPLKLIVPPIFGMGLSIAAIQWIWANFQRFQ